MSDNTKAACDMLAAALAMEDKGKDFYIKAARTCKLDECKRILTMLVDDEEVHKKRIQKISESLNGGEGWCEWDDQGQTHGDLAGMMNQAVKKHGESIRAETSDVEALATAIGIEGESIKFYKQKLDAAEGPVETEFLERMLVEERGHFATLSDMKFYLEDPAGWFQEKEKTGLDGA